LNLAEHVGDDVMAVYRNRMYLKDALRLPSEPFWLNQAHGNQAVILPRAPCIDTADAAYTDRPMMVCAILTADCIPLLICNRQGTEIAAVHAGWRGLATRVIERTLTLFKCSITDLMAWIGPCIGPDHYTVHDDVRNACINDLPDGALEAFTSNGRGGWQADLVKLAVMQLANAGIIDIATSNLCTYAESSLFYSYRREKKTGRMASLIWMDDDRIG
jgi:hypothetical protein